MAKKLNSDAIKSATSTGKYSMGTLNGYFDGARLNLLSSFEVREGQTMYLCITAPGDLLVEYLKKGDTCVPADICSDNDSCVSAAQIHHKQDTQPRKGNDAGGKAFRRG
ncbi:MAG: hypothetical protein ACLSHR_07825 [Oscillospiraceae bacterium]